MVDLSYFDIWFAQFTFVLDTLFKPRD